MSNFKRKLIVGVIISVSAILSILSAWDDSIIVDEVPHIGAGYSYLVKKDMRLNPEHPPLVKDLAAIPLLFLNLDQRAFSMPFWQTDINGQWEFGRYLIFNSGLPAQTGNNADLIKHLAKFPMIIFFILSAVLVFKWARNLYGQTAGLIAVTLFSFSPTVMTHSRLVTTDIPALFGVLIASYFFIIFLKKPGAKNFFWASIVFGLALLTKFSAFLLVPFFAVLALVYGFVKNPRNDKNWFIDKTGYSLKMLGATVALFVIGFALIVWPVYQFHVANYPPERQHRDTEQLLSTYGDRRLADTVVWASDKPILRAGAQYGLGLLMATQRSVGGNTTYFLGEVTRFGWKHYFPIVYFIKEPLAWWGLVLIALITWAWQTKYPVKEWLNRFCHFIRNRLDQFAMILWLAIYWGTSINSTLNIGVRHLLPVFPFAIILVSGQMGNVWAAAKNKSHKLGAAFGVFVLASIGWYIFDVVKIYPFYLSYFNQVAGGPQGGYRYVVDSNLDWGQDLKRFSGWVEENNIAAIEFDYFGWADPIYYLGPKYVRLWSTKYLDATDFKARNQTDGWFAVSATFLQGSQGPEDMPNEINYLWLNSFEPTEIIGNSIFVYRIQ